jgi:hypothetical protein
MEENRFGMITHNTHSSNSDAAKIRCRLGLSFCRQTKQGSWIPLEGCLSNPGASRARKVQEPLGASRAVVPGTCPYLCPCSWCHCALKWQHILINSSHSLPNSPVPNTAALGNFTVFFKAGNLSGVWLHCLIFLFLHGLLNCFCRPRLSRDRR